jgi:hypothetical protein
VEFYKNRPSLIADVSKLVLNFTLKNSKHIMKRFILSLRNNKLFGLGAQFLGKRLQLISVKAHKLKKIQTHHYSLKYKKLNQQLCQLWSLVYFFFVIN